MATKEERLRILELVNSGKISAEQGAKLLAALTPPEADVPTGPPARNLRIRVTDSYSGKQQVNVNLPISLLNFALRFVPNVAGIDASKFDIERVQQAISHNARGRIIDAMDEAEGSRVEIFVE